MDASIRIRALGKQYRIGARARAHQDFRERLAHLAARSWKRLLRRDDGNDEATIWAVRDVSLDVAPGEVLGVIGRNGAGKSTLLKILSRITEPTVGRVELRGRLASLLEVGTGFHADLTGRENVFLSAAILGMRRAEIVRRFDEIVAFAETERFLDTPVKHYSSGMYVRLAFAVAAHLDSDILLVDEVLAVGDAEFQRKCLGRMRDIATRGRTVLFVSHNMSAVQALCQRVIALEGGSVVRDGPPDEVVEAYYASLRRDSSAQSIRDRTDREGSGEARYVAIRFYSGEGKIVEHIAMGEALVVELEFQAFGTLRRPRFHVMFVNALGQVAFRAKTHASMDTLPDIVRGGKVSCRFPAFNALPGLYTITAQINDSVAQRIDGVGEAATIEVVEADVCGTGRVPYERGDLCYMPATWAIEYV